MSKDGHAIYIVLSSPLMQTFKSFEGFKAVAPINQAPVARIALFSRRTPLKIEAARVGGVEIPNQKYIEFSLQYIYGIGPTTAKAIMNDTVSWRHLVTHLVCK